MMSPELPRDENYRIQLLDHFSKHFLGVPKKFEVKLSPWVMFDLADIYFISPTKERDYYVIFSCGMG
mgnify:CR=1 FL=1